MLLLLLLLLLFWIVKEMEKTYKEIVLESHALALLLIGCGYVPHHMFKL